MGYYATTVDSHVKIRRHNQVAAAGAVGAAYGGNTDIADVARDEGFEEATIDENGDFTLSWFNSKTAREEEFLDTIAPYVEDGSYLTWRGEDDMMWSDVFMDGHRWNLPVHIRLELPDPDDQQDERDRQTAMKICRWAIDQGIACEARGED